MFPTAGSKRMRRIEDVSTVALIGEGSVVVATILAGLVLHEVVTLRMIAGTGLRWQGCWPWPRSPDDVASQCSTMQLKNGGLEQKLAKWSW